MLPGNRALALVVLFGAGVVACSSPPGPTILRLATTTSTYDSGLLDAILPDFEQRNAAQVEVVAVGTGQAVAIGGSGDADVILVHNRALEDDFVARGFGLERHPVMVNDFVLVGPTEDPAAVAGSSTAVEALSRIFRTRSAFVSRGDDSGTHAREVALWAAADLAPSAGDNWYLSIGQGMGETLHFAQEVQGYTLSDRGTFLSIGATLPELVVLFGGETIAQNPDPMLLNPYGLIQVTPTDTRTASARAAAGFIAWMTSLRTQEMIRSYGVDRFGQPLFYPASRLWCQSGAGDSPGCEP